MSEEGKAAFDVGAMEKDAFFVNRTQVGLNSAGFVRFSFAESFSPNGPHYYRTAIMMSEQDARALMGLLEKVLSQKSTAGTP